MRRETQRTRSARMESGAFWETGGVRGREREHIVSMLQKEKVFARTGFNYELETYIFTLPAFLAPLKFHVRAFAVVIVQRRKTEILSLSNSSNGVFGRFMKCVQTN